jgi:hypothetical protein
MNSSHSCQYPLQNENPPQNSSSISPASTITPFLFGAADALQRPKRVLRRMHTGCVVASLIASHPHPHSTHYTIYNSPEEILLVADNGNRDLR